MVGQSDLAFRLLCLRHGASVCWTEMFYSHKIVHEHDYLSRGEPRQQHFDRNIAARVHSAPALTLSMAVRV